MNQSKRILRTLLRIASSKLLWGYLVILLISLSSANAQSNNEDNLRTKLSNTTSDSGRIDLLIELSKITSNKNIEQSLQYSHEALSLSRKLNEKEKEAEIMFELGLILFETSEIDSSLIYFEASEQLADTLKLRELQSDNLMRIANWYRYHRADSTQTVKYLQKSVVISKAANYHYGTGRSYAKLASFYTKYKEIHLCKEYMNNSSKYYLQTENGKNDIAHYYNEVGNKIWVYNPKESMDFYFLGLNYLNNHPLIKVSLGKAYSSIQQSETALKYLKEAVALLDTIGKERDLGIALAQLAEVQVQLGNYKEALETCKKTTSLLAPLSLSNHSSLPSIYRTQGHLAEIESNDKSALELYLKSLEKAEEINSAFEPVKMIPMTVKSNIVIGNFYSQRAPKKGIEYCKTALDNASKHHYSALEIDACSCLYKIFKAEHNYADALKYTERKEAVADSLSTLGVEYAFEVAKKDKQLAEEAFQKERKEEQLKNQKKINTTLGISTLLGLLLIGFLAHSRRKIHNQNSEIIAKTTEIEKVNLSLTRSNEDLERFAHAASHDLKSPLSTIVNFTGLINKSIKKEENPKVKEYLQYIQVSGKRMRQLIDDILEFSKLPDKNHTTSEIEVVDLNEVIKEISQLIENTPINKSVNILNNLPNLKWNNSNIFLLFKNLIENGLKYNESENPEVKLHYSTSGDIHTISIEDNGIGIKKKYFDKIFVMFERLHNQSTYEGTGLGLATCKKIAEEFGGKISIESKENEGTKFIIELPKNIIV